MSNLSQTQLESRHYVHARQRREDSIERGEPSLQQNKQSGDQADNKNVTSQTLVELGYPAPVAKATRLTAELKSLPTQGITAFLTADSERFQTPQSTGDNRNKEILKEAGADDSIQWHTPEWPTHGLSRSADQSDLQGPESYETLSYEEFCAMADSEAIEPLDSDPLAGVHSTYPHSALLMVPHVSSNEAGNSWQGAEDLRLISSGLSFELLAALKSSEADVELPNNCPGSFGEVETDGFSDSDPCPFCGEYCDDCASEDSLG